MNLSEYLHEDLVLLNLQSRSKPPLFEEMVSHMVNRGYIEDGAEVVRLLMEREKLMSTGIKRGIAIPHAFTPRLKKSHMLVGISKRGIDFEALDDEPVFLVFLLLGPPGEQGLHMRLLARLSRLMNQDSFYGRLEAAQSAKEVIQIIKAEEMEARHTPPPALLDS